MSEFFGCRLSQAVKPFQTSCANDHLSKKSIACNLPAHFTDSASITRAREGGMVQFMQLQMVSIRSEKPIIMRSIPCLRSFLNVAFEISSNVHLPEDVPSWQESA